jgi:hypothetical protein
MLARERESGGADGGRERRESVRSKTPNPKSAPLALLPPSRVSAQQPLPSLQTAASLSLDTAARVLGSSAALQYLVKGLGFKV